MQLKGNLGRMRNKKDGNERIRVEDVEGRRREGRGEREDILEFAF